MATPFGVFGTKKPVIGMVHLEPLPGAPTFSGSLPQVLEAAMRDARRLAEGGVDGLAMENFGDAPFFPGRVPAETVAAMTWIAAEIRRAVDLPLGINVLRNDGMSAMAIANAVGAAFIRVNVLVAARVTDQGVIQGIAHDLLRYRRSLGCGDVLIFADVDVKHSAPLGAYPLEGEVLDAAKRGLADALIVSGSGTGHAASRPDVERVKSVSPVPVLIGSGVTTETVAELMDLADGAIIGSAFKEGGQVLREVDVQRVKALMSRL